MIDGRYGEVVRVRDLRRRLDRRLQFDVVLPGYGLPTAATMTLIERWHLTADRWRLVAYTYDYLLEPRGSGRRAHHLHDGVPHAHCEDPWPKHDHYRDVAVDLLEAAEEFASYFALGELTCVGLFPL